MNWDDLLDDVDDQQCILFVGPEIVRINQVPMNEAIRQFVTAQCPPDQILQYYNRDGFFLFKDGTAKTNARRYYKRFFRDHAFDEDVFRKIVAIPFPLVVSINADTVLDDVAYKYGVRHRFSFYKDQAAVQRPSAVEPLFYNLCGCKNRDDSLLLDYEDLFKLLQWALGPDGLPQKLLEVLGTARTFLFLGFQFDKWHTQLLLRLLQGERNDVSNYVIRTLPPDAETQAFLVNQFNIRFLGDQFDFFEELYRRCAERGSLRPLNPPLSLRATEVIRDLQNNKVGEALERLKMFADQQKEPSLSKMVTLLFSQYEHLTHQSERGLLDSRDAAVQRNRILDAILETAQQMP